MLRIHVATRRGKASKLSAKFLAYVSAHQDADVTCDSPIELNGSDEDKTTKVLRALLDYEF